MTPEERAVVEAADKWHAETRSLGDVVNLMTAVDALRAARAPRDPIDVALRALRSIRDIGKGPDPGSPQWQSECAANIARQAIVELSAIKAEKGRKS
jgi:hypothetical protein